MTRTQRIDRFFADAVARATVRVVWSFTQDWPDLVRVLRDEE